ncbi:MAG: FtsX-like permease family protein [Gemmatimonas sp.]|nr:FtsX-like permease family protein [Gemmatimonas sp.]
MLNRMRLWLRSHLFRQRLEEEMQAEMAEHIDRSTKRLIARGLSPDEVRREAHLEFGNVGYLREEGRIARGTAWFDTLIADLRFGLRHFVRNPLSTLTIVAVLSVGIGINVVLFTLVYSFTDRPPSGVEMSDELVRIRGSQIGLNSRVERAFTREEIEAYAGLKMHFSAIAAWTSQPVTSAGPGVAETTVTATFVAGDYFELLGVQPVLGSGLVEDDAAQGAVLSHALWTRSFAEDPGVLGRTITFHDVPFTIVGIAPPRFRGASWEARDDMQVWLPLSGHRRVFPEIPSEAELFRAIARLQPGITHETAGAAVDVVAGRIMSDLDRAPSQDAFALGRDPSAEVVPLLADNLELGFEANARFVKLSFGVLGLLTLLVTCANVSALQTGLALARRREIAIRMSLGAQRVRVIRQLVTESLLLSILAAGAAVGVSLALMRVLLSIVGAFSFDLVFDRTTLLVTFGVALAAGLLFGLSPALHATRVAIAGALKDSAGSIAGGRARLQRGLVIAQIALTQPLAVCVATLVVLGVFEYRNSPRNPYGEQIVQVRLASASTRNIPITGDAAEDRERRETERLIEVFRQEPGITNAVYFPNRVPIDQDAFTLPDSARTGSDDVEPFYLVGRAVMPGYLDLIGTPIVLGRDLEPADTAGFPTAAIPVIIGDDMARSLWGDESPVGRRVEGIAAVEEPMMLEVVGVYEKSFDAPGHSRNPFTIFLPLDPRLASRSASRFIMLRTSSPAETMMPTIREIVRDEAPRAAITELHTLASAEGEERFVLWGAIALFSSGGLVVLLLCALGLYAVVAFAVGQRTGEIAVRMAIGARTRQIVRHFASDGLRLGVFGIVIGLPLSVLGLRMLMQLAPQTPPVSLPAITAIVAVGVLLVAGLATWIPASRAAEVDPALTLRKE